MTQQIIYSKSGVKIIEMVATNLEARADIPWLFGLPYDTGSVQVSGLEAGGTVIVEGINGDPDAVPDPTIVGEPLATFAAGDGYAALAEPLPTFYRILKTVEGGGPTATTAHLQIKRTSRLQ